MIQRTALKPMLRDALGDWEQIQNQLESADRILLFSEFDGVLSSCGEDPSRARIDPDVQIALRRLSVLDRITPVLISGRSVHDLEASVGLPLVFVGDHATEIRGPGIQFSAPEADRIRGELPAICQCLKSTVSRIPGTFVEPRRLGATVYCRSVSPYLHDQIVTAVHNCVDPGRYEVVSGNCVVDIRARLNWTRADAVLWLLHRFGVDQRHTVWLAGDESYRQMFASVPDAINVQVGFAGEELGAPYWIPQPDVAQFLLRLMTLAGENREHRTTGRRVMAFGAH